MKIYVLTEVLMLKSGSVAPMNELRGALKQKEVNMKQRYFVYNDNSRARKLQSFSSLSNSSGDCFGADDLQSSDVWWNHFRCP